jgi:hypothetical protein
MGGMMARMIQDKCDGPGCTNVRKETNHWFKIFFQHIDSLTFTVTNWNYEHELSKKVYFACGEACLLKIISEHIKNDTAKT